MSRTDNVSIVASLLGFLLAVYSIFTQPIVVDSARPTQTGSGDVTQSEEPAYARLWDDPFAVYSDIYNPLPQKPQLPVNRQRTLFLVIPTKTFAYEEDKENRLRIRYAVERALFDQGFVARSANFLSTIDLTGDSSMPGSRLTDGNSGQTKVVAVTPKQTKRSAPIQLFTRSWPTNSETDEFSAVVIVWLPDSYMWTLDRTEEDTNGSLRSALRHLQEQFHDGRNDRWVLLGPSDSDSLAFFERHQNPLGTLRTPFVVVPYRATIAQALLERIIQTQPASVVDPVSNIFTAPSGQLIPAGGIKAATRADLTVIRFPNGDDVLCLELLRAVRDHNISLIGSNPLKVLIFAEWDTLYGRSLAKTFTALAERGRPSGQTTDVLVEDTFRRRGSRWGKRYRMRCGRAQCSA